MGQIYLVKRQLGPARAQFEAAVKADSQFAPAWVDLAEALIASGKRQEALPLLLRAQQSSTPAVAHRATELLRQMGPS